MGGCPLNGKIFNMEQIITLLLEAAVVYFIVRVVIAVVAISKEVKQAEIAKEQALVQTNDVELRIEVHGNVAYFFNKNTNEFIAQGSTADELIDHITGRKFTNIKFLVDNNELSKVEWLEEVFRAHKVEA